MVARSILPVFLAFLALLAACGPAPGPAISHARLDAELQPLRSEFNADAGKVRVLMLVAPT